jgi:hypothetical protein
VRKFGWQFNLALLLIASSVLVYVFYYVVFRDADFMAQTGILDLGFLPISVLLVTLVLDGLMSRREKLARLNKLNMVIGVFFSEVGTELLEVLSRFSSAAELKKELANIREWSLNDFDQGIRRVKNYDMDLDLRPGDLQALKERLVEMRDFLLRLLENPTLLEHESFTELLWAVFHLVEELRYRPQLLNMRKADHRHLVQDIERVYALLIIQWLEYMKHLKLNYGYMFSLDVRINPFDPEARPEVGE